ncbi:hypothetical protein LPB140_08485 [Sphingorhabdus lutea]|uniref:NfeD-like C-terminal domain-containing protein n=1 Tax=Sphingorhabdus lutea TaxID=1913578 RepID=A0A1L3JCJ6_9SPHN|nr:NfeD family protein [Sphingorhabdus lutea]APG62819.1 hypothetical protein LPB140_08485 [Sphingorhabdus lutea]
METHFIWLSFAIILAIAELIVPGVFLIWIAAAAALTGGIAFFIDIPSAAQFLIFAGFSIISVVIGRRFFLEEPASDESLLLNDRAKQLIGKTVTVVEPIGENSGRVKVADGEWNARGPNLEIGATAKISSVKDGVIYLEKA